MTEFQPKTTQRLAFRIITPLVLIGLLTGSSLYFSVFRSISGFIEERITAELKDMARQFYNICDRNLNDLLMSRAADDKNALWIKKGLAMGQLEDFLRENSLQGYLIENGETLVATWQSPSDLLKLIEKNKKRGLVTLTKFENKHYYVYFNRNHYDFGPWKWNIVLIKEAGQYSSLMKQVRNIYITSGMVHLIGAFFVFFLFRQSIEQPVRKIIAQLKKGEPPAYRGIYEFEFLSSNIRQIMDSLQEKTKWINQIYNIAVTKRGVDFFDDIATALGEIFNLNSTIAKVNPDGETASVVSMFLLEGTLRKNIPISLAGTPCEGVKKEKKIAIIPAGVYKDFPNVKGVCATPVETYMGMPILDRGGAVVAVMNVFGKQRDFSEADINLFKTIGQIVSTEFEILEKESEKEALMQQILLEQKLKAIGILASGVAHNFNNMLVGVLGYTSLIRIKLEEAQKEERPLQGDALAEIVKHLQTVESSAQRAGNLAKELGHIAKRKASSEGLISLIDINKIIKELQQLLVNIFSKNITIAASLSENIPAVQGDALQLEQAFLNICINSNDAMPNGGELTIETFVKDIAEKNPGYPFIKTGQYVTIRISDTGHGMDSETLNHIFEPFFTTKPVDKGTGLGLATAYSTIKAHNGYITVESSQDSGSTFTILLPVAQQE